MKKAAIEAIVNGERVRAEVPPGLRLLDWLREDLRLTGTKEGCGEGDCGACTVLMDGKPINSCLALAVDAHGKTIITIEGLSQGERHHPLLEAFIQNGAVQCGFCTPGMVLSSLGLLAQNPQPTEGEVREALSGNLCRCTGYSRIVKAVLDYSRKAFAGKGSLPQKSGWESTGESKSSRVVGKRVRKPDAASKVRGHAQFIHDLTVPQMLCGKILYSTEVHARILGIDTSKAEALPGVKVVLTGKDLPESARYGLLKDNPPLKKDRVRSIRDEVAAVAALDEVTARKALALIDVKYERLPSVFDVEAALAPGAPVLHDGNRGGNLIPLSGEYRHGDVQAGFAEADVVVEGEFTLPYVSHVCMGTSGALSYWDNEGNLTIHTPTQIPFFIQRDLAGVLGIEGHKLRVIQPAIGGAFGSKLDIHDYEILSAFLARKAGRPVKILFDREEEFRAVPTRQPMRIRMRTGAKKDGTLVAREADLLLDNGAYVSWGATTPFVMQHTFACLYRVPHVRLSTRIAYTNNPFATAFRGYGNPQITFAMESQMDELSQRLGMDPIDLRLKNANQAGDLTPQGSRITSCGFTRCLEEARKFIGKARKKKAPAGRRRGVGVACMFHVGGGARIYRSDGCGVMVKVDDFGRVTVITGATEIGQGSDTAQAQIAAQVLGLPFENVYIVKGDTHLGMWDVGCHASRTTFISGNAVKLAAEKIRGQILQAAAGRLECPPEELDLADGLVFSRKDPGKKVEITKVIRAIHFCEGGRALAAESFYDPPNEMVNKEFRGNISAAYTWGVHVAEVEVDEETGEVEVKGIYVSHDVGRVINPLGIEGQVEGGVAQGLGYALTEELQVEEGRLRNPNLHDYRIFTALDMPPIEMRFVESNDPEGPFGAKGIGEAPLIPVAPAVANAIRDAVGVRLRRLPMIPESILNAIQARKNHSR